LHHRDTLDGKNFRQHLGQQRRGARRGLGRLQHHVVAGCERIDQRYQCKIDRIIPRTDDADDAQRFRHDFAMCGKEGGIGRDAARAHPAAQALVDVVDLVEHGHAVGQQCFHARAMAEVGTDGAHEILQPRLECAAQARQVIHSLRMAGRARLPGRTLGLQQGAEIGDRRIHGLGPALRCSGS
jgi:hypothetical protein